VSEELRDSRRSFLDEIGRLAASEAGLVSATQSVSLTIDELTVTLLAGDREGPGGGGGGGGGSGVGGGDGGVGSSGDQRSPDSVVVFGRASRAKLMEVKASNITLTTSVEEVGLFPCHRMLTSLLCMLCSSATECCHLHTSLLCMLSSSHGSALQCAIPLSADAVNFTRLCSACSVPLPPNAVTFTRLCSACCHLHTSLLCMLSSSHVSALHVVIFTRLCSCMLSTINCRWHSHCRNLLHQLFFSPIVLLACHPHRLFTTSCFHRPRPSSSPRVIHYSGRGCLPRRVRHRRTCGSNAWGW
jgi:hypothetical protein